MKNAERKLGAGQIFSLSFVSMANASLCDYTIEIQRKRFTEYNIKVTYTGAVMLVVVCIFLISSIARYCSSEETLGKVVFANVLYRHGDRTPLESYPNDPYKDEHPQLPFGQLTLEGMGQQAELGKWLRNRYAHLLSFKYSEDDIYVSSIDAKSTWSSAGWNIVGIYPDSWWKVPVHSIPKSEDNLLAGTKFCKAYSRLWEHIRGSAEIKKVNEEFFAEIFDFLSEMTGKNISTIDEVGRLYDTLYIQELNNKALPSWTSSKIKNRTVYPEELKIFARLALELPVMNPYMQRLKAGPLLKEMIQHMELKANDTLTPNRKLWVYSGYDSTIVNVLKALKVFEPHLPPYAAALLIELRVNAQNEHVVTIFYKNSTAEPTLLTLPDCAAACPLNNFINLTAEVVPDNWEQECSWIYGETFPKCFIFMRHLIRTGLAVVVAAFFLVVMTHVFSFLFLRPDINNNNDRSYNLP